MLKPITIAGGGLAGLALGIALRQRGIPCTVWEAGYYPRHRVCGEFICGRGVNVLRQLGLFDTLMAARGRFAQTASFFSHHQSLGPLVLPQPALCLSRYVLDAQLASEFRRLGGSLLEGQRWCAPSSDGIVLATGRRIQSAVAGWRWFGLKVHASGVELESDLEMHRCETGYVGLCRLSEEQVNVCALLRSRSAIRDLAQSWPQRICGEAGTALHGRMQCAVFDHRTFCSVAGLYLPPQKAAERSDCCIGDALTMIAPVTGNGMSMAFESADFAIEPLTEYSHGQISWSGARGQVAAICDQRFATRLRWSRFVQWTMFHPFVSAAFLVASNAWPQLWIMAFKNTR